MILFKYNTSRMIYNIILKDNMITYDNMRIGNLFLILAQVVNVSDSTPSEGFSPKNMSQILE